MYYLIINFNTDPPPCKGKGLPDRRPVYFERLYEDDIDYFVSDGRRLNAVPSYINPYKDDSDLLFSIIFSRVKNASACVVVSSVTTKAVAEKTKELKKTHRIKTASCYYNADNKLRCIAVFCPKREVPLTECSLHQSYFDYQNKVIKQQERGYKVFQRKLYYKDGTYFVDVCYQKESKKNPLIVSLSDKGDIRSLTQMIQRNEQRGLYLTDGNARMERNRMEYSAVFSTVKYGSCDYQVLYNLDALQLYDRERALARDNYHLTAIIPTTGSLTPQFIAVFWR